MRHDEVRAAPSFLIRKRFQFVGALLIGAGLPWLARGPLPGSIIEPASINALTGNIVAVTLAFWTRLSIETYPGIRRSSVILPAALTGHGVAVVWFVLTRFPYDRLALAAGFLLHVAWLYILYIRAERKIRRRIAVVPFGERPTASTRSMASTGIILKRPKLHDARSCSAIVADFSAQLPDEWEAFLADAALAGRIVYQVKQLSESLTGRVQLEHLSENSFGSLVPKSAIFTSRGWWTSSVRLRFCRCASNHAAVWIAIRLERRGSAFFRQKRVGHAGRTIAVYKFRTMHCVEIGDERSAAMTRSDDDSITRVGAVLRKLASTNCRRSSTS